MEITFGIIAIFLFLINRKLGLIFNSLEDIREEVSNNDKANEVEVELAKKGIFLKE